MDKDPILEKLEKRLTSFKKAAGSMIATNDTAYNGTAFEKTKALTNYTVEEAQKIIDSGTPDQLKNLSEFYFYSSGFYRRIIAYYATLLKYSGILIPHLLDPKKKLTDTKLSKKYYEASNFYDNLEIIDICTSIVTQTLVDGAYYGMIKDFGDTGFVLQDLPFEYCRSRFKNSNNVDLVELDMKYFDQIRDADQKAIAIASFPSEIQKGYRNYQKNSQARWVFIPEDLGVYVSLIEEKPFFLNIIPAVINFQDYKDIEKNKDAQEIKKVLVQKIPTTNAGELVFEPEEAEEMHRGTVGMLKKNADISVLTTYADVSLESMVDARQTIANNLDKIEKTIYSEAGVSKQLFAADGNLSMEKSLQNDLSLMMILGNKIANILTCFINKKFGDNKISFKVRMLPISYYNSREYNDNVFKLATSGYSYIIPALTCGINQSDLIDLKKLENELLQLEDVLKPLQSAYTQSAANQKESGAPKKEEDAKSDKTIQNQDSLDKGGTNNG